MMAPSDGVLRRPRGQLGAAGTCVGVRDWRGLRLKLSRWVLTSGLTGAGGAGAAIAGSGGGAGREASSSSLSQRSSEWVELQSDREDRDSRV